MINMIPRIFFLFYEEDNIIFINLMTKTKFKIKIAIGTNDELEQIGTVFPNIKLIRYENISKCNKSELITSVALLYNKHNDRFNFEDILIIKTNMIKYFMGNVILNNHNKNISKNIIPELNITDIKQRNLDITNERAIMFRNAIISILKLAKEKSEKIPNMTTIIAILLDAIHRKPIEERIISNPLSYDAISFGGNQNTFKKYINETFILNFMKQLPQKDNNNIPLYEFSKNIFNNQSNDDVKTNIEKILNNNKRKHSNNDNEIVKKIKLDDTEDTED